MFAACSASGFLRDALRIACRSDSDSNTCNLSPPLTRAMNFHPRCQTYFMPRFLAADFKLQNSLNFSSERASLINILQCLTCLESKEMFRSSVLKRVRFDFASNTLLTREREKRRTAILHYLFDCSLFFGGTERGRAIGISELWRQPAVECHHYLSPASRSEPLPKQHRWHSLQRTEAILTGL